MVIDESQFLEMKRLEAIGQNPASKLGGWATKDQVNSIADMRNNLAITEEFKPQTNKDRMANKFYVVEFEVQPSVGLREGKAGSMYDYVKDQILPGNAHQVNFMKNTPRTNPELFKLDLNNVKEIK